MGVLMDWAKNYYANLQHKKAFAAIQAKAQYKMDSYGKKIANTSQYRHFLTTLKQVPAEYRDSFLQGQEASGNPFARNLLLTYRGMLDDARMDSLLLGANQEHEAAIYRQTLLKNEMAFMRPNTAQDIAERQRALDGFVEHMRSVDPHDVFKFRFHATSLSVTQQIIESGGLIASADRQDAAAHGTRNNSNEIAVSDIHNLEVSVTDNFDFLQLRSYDTAMPAGCLFVLQPKTQEEIDLISKNAMHNVDFVQNPEQLIGIVTTSENLPMLQSWLSERGLNPDIASTFQKFPDVLHSRIAPILEEMGLNDNTPSVEPRNVDDGLEL